MKTKIFRFLPAVGAALLLTACDSRVDLVKEKAPSEAVVSEETEINTETEAPEELETEQITEASSEQEPVDETGSAGSGTPALSLIFPIPVPAQELPQPSENMQTLKWKLSRMISGWEGRWSVYALNLKTEEELCIRDVSMPSASLMKLFIMGTVYQAIEDGVLERNSEIMGYMSGMIAASSNGDANRLLAKLGDGDHEKGIARVNDYIREHGYSADTHQYNGFQDDSLVFDEKHHNSVSARDCGQLLRLVYHRDFGSRRVCNEVEDWMLRQGTRYKIPAGIGADVPVGNKTGETDDIENDAAIVYAGPCDFILVVLSCDWPDKNAAQKQIQQIARRTYLSLTGQDTEDTRILIPEGIYLLSAHNQEYGGVS